MHYVDASMGLPKACFEISWIKRESQPSQRYFFSAFGLRNSIFFFFSHFLIFTLIFQLYTKFVETLQSCIWTHTAFVSKSWLDEQPIINLNNWRFFLFTGTEICSTGHWVGAHHITEFAPRVEQEYSTILEITNDLSLANFFVFKLINLQLLS